MARGTASRTTRFGDPEAVLTRESRLIGVLIGHPTFRHRGHRVVRADNRSRLRNGADSLRSARKRADSSDPAAATGY